VIVVVILAITEVEWNSIVKIAVYVAKVVSEAKKRR
jgi:hypothetical protein